jgi:RNA polymerase sigma-70 factor (ECF subfamily)
LSHRTESPPSDEELVCRAQAGCAASFDELVRRFQVPVLHFLQQRGAAAAAEDLVQDTFVRAYENLHRYRAKWPFKTWLLTIARRLRANHARRTTPVAHSEALLALTPAAAPSPVDTAIAAEGRQRLWDVAAGVLSEEQLAALWLHYVEELPTRQIAQVLGRSRLAVKALLFRARKKLRPWVGNEDAPAERTPSLPASTDDFAPWREEVHHA